MTINLDNLMALQGAIASGEFDQYGRVVASKGDPSAKLSELIDMMSAVNSAMKNVEEKMKAMESSTHKDSHKACVEGWAVSAGGFSMCVIGNAGVFVKSDTCNFKGVLRALGKEVGAI